MKRTSPRTRVLMVLLACSSVHVPHVKHRKISAVFIAATSPLLTHGLSPLTRSTLSRCHGRPPGTDAPGATVKPRQHARHISGPRVHVPTTGHLWPLVCSPLTPCHRGHRGLSIPTRAAIELSGRLSCIPGVTRFRVFTKHSDAMPPGRNTPGLPSSCG